MSFRLLSRQHSLIVTPSSGTLSLNNAVADKSFDVFSQ
jgi:hypothetical protein